MATRAEVDEKWTAFGEGRLTAAEVHAWADRQVVDHEPLAESGVQDLYGLSGRHFRGSTEDILARLAKWRGDCADHDADPEGWRQERVARARRGLGIE